MLPDLDRLIRLQELETAVHRARQALEALPAQREALEARLAEHTGRIETLDRTIAERKAARRVMEKDAAAAQSRLARFKDQLMAVKTNREYHAVQSEIENANAEIRSIEDRILEDMLAADELADEVRAARQAMAEEQTAVGEEKSRLERERGGFQARVERYGGDRAALAAGLDPQLLETFDTLIRGRKGIAVSAARDGRCGACQVRLRPQLYNDVLRNERLFQCESCQRILHSSLEKGGSPEPEATRNPLARKRGQRIR